MSDDQQQHAGVRPSRFSGRDGVTQDQRDRPPVDDERTLVLERDAASMVPSQLDLFATIDAGTWEAEIGGLPPVAAHSSLDLARSAYRRELEHRQRPRNTIESYCYDLQVLEDMIGPKPINRIDGVDVARFLGEATSKSTRKRRLTSLRRFFRYLIDDAKVLRFDPTEGYYPHQIQLRLPIPLFRNEQRAMLDAAAADEAWSLLAIWLMMRLGLTRSELLALERDHIDRSDPETPVVHVLYREASRQSKERRLAADAEFAAIYSAYLDTRENDGALITVGPQAVNTMVDRVRKAAHITKDVTPQTLRSTFAVERARAGADQADLLALLGLADDPRNRQSVRRYIALAAEPASVTPLP